MKRLILGGVKSGKSRYAENYVQSYLDAHNLSDSAVCLIATAEPLDSGMANRIQKHKEQRPESWHVIEEPISLSEAMLAADKTAKIILIDCLTLWLTNLLMKQDEVLLDEELENFEQAIMNCSAELVMVSNETNMGVMPLGALTRDYCDTAGVLHQRLAAICDNVELVVAGLPLSLKSTTNTKQDT